MSFVVDCPCGKTYQKSERKAGTKFRCFTCGRELTVPLTQPLADAPFAAEPAAPAAVAPPLAAADPVEDDKIPPPRRGLLRTLFAWGLIVLGLIGVVGGAGQLLIFWIVDQANRNQAAAEAQFVGNVLVQPRRPATDVPLGYATGIGGIVVGVVVASAGLVLRHVTGPPVVPSRRKKPKRRLQPAPTEAALGRANDAGDCPECGAAMAHEAILCIACGFNRKTGERLRAAVATPVRHFLPEGGWLVRLFICVLLLPLGVLAAIAVMQEPWARAVAGPSVGVVLLLLGGSWRRLTVLRDDAGRPWLITRHYLAFVPRRPTRCDLRRYGTIRLGYTRELRAKELMLGLLLVGVFVVFMRRERYTVEVTGVFENGLAPDVQPLEVYYGSSERLSRELADALRSIGGLRIG